MLSHQCIPQTRGARPCAHYAHCGTAFVRFNVRRVRCTQLCVPAAGRKSPGPPGTRREQAQQRRDEDSAPPTPDSEIGRAEAEAIFKNAAEQPREQCGPATVVQTMERGRGIAAGRGMVAGDLLFVSHPIALVYGDGSVQYGTSAASEEDEVKGGRTASSRRAETPPTETEDDSDVEDDEQDPWDVKFDALITRMRSQRYSSSDAKWLESLAAMIKSRHDRANGASKGAQAGDGTYLPPLPDLCGMSSSQRGGSQQQLPQLLANDTDLLEELAQTTTYEASSEDADLAYAAGDEPRKEVIGLWPEYALLNHSCVPSTISYAHKGALITRVTRRSVTKGGELFTNYIGDLAMAPLDVRREPLEDVYGFVCGCARCKEEERLDKDLKQLILDIYEACTEQVSEDLEAAVEEDDDEALEGLKAQLAAFAEVLDAAFMKKAVGERTQIWIQAGLFRLYELLYCCLEALGERDLRLTELLQALAGAIQPGSELHCFWARAHLEAVQEEAVRPSTPPPAAKPKGKGGRGSGKGKDGATAQGSGVEGDADSDPMEAMMGGGKSAGVGYADQLCYRAHSARYGPISRATYRMLLKTRQELEAQDEEDEQ